MASIGLIIGVPTLLGNTADMANVTREALTLKLLRQPHNTARTYRSKQKAWAVGLIDLRSPPLFILRTLANW
jgi:hypothetical protein